MQTLQSQFVFVKMGFANGLYCNTFITKTKNEKTTREKELFFCLAHANSGVSKNHMHTKGSTPHQHLFILQPILCAVDVDYVSPFKKNIYDIIVFIFHTIFLSLILSFVGASLIASWLG